MAFSTDMGITEIQAGLRAGDFTTREVAKAALAHVKAADEKVHAFLELTEEAAYAAADRVDAAIAAGSFDELGPLAGIPCAFKDNMNQEGTPPAPPTCWKTTCPPTRPRACSARSTRAASP